MKQTPTTGSSDDRQSREPETPDKESSNDGKVPEGPLSTTDRPFRIPLVGKFDFQNPTPIITPAHDEFDQKIDELNEYERVSEGLRELGKDRRRRDGSKRS